MSHTSDLVEDSRLATKFLDDDTTIHTFREPYGRHRLIHREEHWKRERRLGRGGFGKIYLEKCTVGNEIGALRAVKVVDKLSDSGEPIRFDRELEAIAKFSSNRVRQNSSTALNPAYLCRSTTAGS
jgi:hypothetical protein